MRFYSRNFGYFWDIDRYKLFTESEKCFLLDILNTSYSLYKEIDKEVGGVTYMIFGLIQELEESIENDG